MVDSEALWTFPSFSLRALLLAGLRRPSPSAGRRRPHYCPRARLSVPDVLEPSPAVASIDIVGAAVGEEDGERRGRAGEAAGAREDDHNPRR